MEQFRNVRNIFFCDSCLLFMSFWLTNNLRSPRVHFLLKPLWSNYQVKFHANDQVFTVGKLAEILSIFAPDRHYTMGPRGGPISPDSFSALGDFGGFLNSNQTRHGCGFFKQSAGADSREKWTKTWSARGSRPKSDKMSTIAKIGTSFFFVPIITTQLLLHNFMAHESNQSNFVWRL